MRVLDFQSMPARTRQLIARMTFLLMMATFLSPSLGWQMAVVHEHEGRHLVLAEPDHHHVHVSGSGHEHMAAQEKHEDAHSMMGHLLGHMPLSLTQESHADAAAATMVLNSHPPDGMSEGLPDNRFRPPLNLLA